MTPISEMTNEELDRYIAELRGWKYFPDGHWKWVLYYDDKECEGEYQYICPSFTTDPRYAMELLKDFHDVTLYKNGNFWHCSFGSHVLNGCKTPERAISEAYAQWKGEK